VQAGGRLFILPTANTDSFIETAPGEIVSIEDRDTLMLDKTIITVSSLENLLDLPISAAYKKNSDDRVTVGILRSGSERAGFIVEDVLGEQEVLVKALGPVFSGVTAVSGVTILGSGQIAPILSVFELFKMQRASGARALARTAAVSVSGNGGDNKGKSELRKRVLVVDDMVTARMLVRNIFELAGYQVRTANDGLEAFDLLRSEKFDCVVSDIEMPRMDGIALTQAIRSDVKLRELPVILITNMASREDRERGVSAGANAYFVKSSFDQANLLDVVATLIG
jgi:two-component system chemotaxis sensor kinase CheA